MSYHDHSFLPPDDEELTREERYARRVMNEVHRMDAAQIAEERRREAGLEDDFSFTTDPHADEQRGRQGGWQEDRHEGFSENERNGSYEGGQGGNSGGNQGDQRGNYGSSEGGQGDNDGRNQSSRQGDSATEAQAHFASSDKPKKNRGTAFWQLISGTILLHEGLSQYYRYMLWIAVLFFASIAVMFMTLHLDRRYAELETQVRVLRAKATLLEEERCRKTTYTSIFNELKKRNIDLLPREKPWHELTE